MTSIPERVGRYWVREVIGTGAFGTVYRATDERLGVDVAVKVLAENHSLDADVRDRFIEEGRRLRRVRSPHLLAVYDLGETERVQPYLVLEWADRGDLWNRVAEAAPARPPPVPEHARDVARVLTEALDVLHRASHRPPRHRAEEPAAVFHHGRGARPRPASQPTPRTVGFR